MNCCYDSHDEHQGHQPKNKSRMSHLWMMVLCCGLPILLLFLMPMLGRFIPGVSASLGTVIPFLCPLMMIAMIPMMIRGSKGDGGEKACTAREQEGETPFGSETVKK